MSVPFCSARLIRLWISLIHNTVVPEKLLYVHGKQARNVALPVALLRWCRDQIIGRTEETWLSIQQGKRSFFQLNVHIGYGAHPACN
jgi:hypothetical protein